MVLIKENVAPTDENGRPWAKLSELKAGDKVELDGGFLCHGAGVVEVKQNALGTLYFECQDGNHRFDSQADDGEHLIGIYKVEA
jgi:hypothetical protein